MMYTMVPFRSRREISRPMMNALFDDRFFRSFFDMGDMVGQAGFRVDIRDMKDAYRLEAELPGVRQQDISLSVENDVLTIATDLHSEQKQERDSYLYSERRSGHVSRSFNLEGINQDAIKASYRDGVLTVDLPKLQPEPEKAARQITIENGSDTAAEGEQPEA